MQRTEQDFIHFLTGGSPSHTLCVLDFDGTVYRGLFPRVLRGVSNAEFAFFLELLHLRSPGRAWNIFRELVLLREKAYDVYRLPEQHLSDWEQPLIEQFAERVLSQCHYPLVETAANYTARFCYTNAFRVLDVLQRHVGEIVFISKAFPMVLHAVRDRMLAEGIRIPVNCHGIALRDDPWWKIDPAQSVLNWRDKQRALATFAGDNPCYDRALIIGDTRDDAAMLEEGKDLWGRESTVLVGLHPKDADIRSQSTVPMHDWASLLRVLTEPGRSTCQRANTL